eukprot:11139112-Heterocapsa_arctica.AAC.1
MPIPGYEGSGGFHGVGSMKCTPEILANLWVAFLNVAYLGEGADTVSFSALCRTASCLEATSVTSARISY